MDTSLLLYQNFNGRWYNRLGRFLIDEALGEDTKITVVRFASDAYFELVRNRSDLRPVLAASSNVAVMAGEGNAILVSDRVGLEEFSDEHRKQFGFTVR